MSCSAPDAHRRTTPSRRVAAALAVAPVVFVLGVELVHRCAAGWGFPPAAGHPSTPRGPHVVLVLGCPSRPDGRLHPVQRWRTEIAARSARGPGTRWVFSGGGPAGTPAEAAVMAAHAHAAFGIAPERTTLETRSRSTWENVAFCLPHLQDAATLAIASSPTHAARARRYLAQQCPDLAQRLVPADDYRFGERLGAKVGTLGYGVARLLVSHGRDALRRRPSLTGRGAAGPPGPAGARRRR